MENDPKIPKWLWAAILAVAVAVSCVQNSNAAEQQYNAAPVVKYESGTVMIQTSWYRYKPLKDITVLYCVDKGDPTLTCVVYVKVEAGAGIALVEGVIPSGGSF